MTTEHRTVEISGVTYRIGRLSARKQFHVARRLAPLLSDVITAGLPENKDDLLAALAGPLAKSLSDMKDEDADFVIDACLGVAYRKQFSGKQETWAPVARGGRSMFEDMNMADEVGITLATIQENLGSFFPTDLPTSPAEAEKVVPEAATS